MSARAKASAAEYFHYHSVHVRDDRGGGYDFEMDLHLSVSGRGRRRQEEGEMVVTFSWVEYDQVLSTRVTRDRLTDDHLQAVLSLLPVMMEEGNPEVVEMMQGLAEREMRCQARIDAGEEHACAACGCSETRACSGGCFWATRALCSRCV